VPDLLGRAVSTALSPYARDWWAHSGVHPSVMVEQLTCVSMEFYDHDRHTVGLESTLRKRMVGYARQRGHRGPALDEANVRLGWAFSNRKDPQGRPEVPHPIRRRHPDYEPAPWSHLAYASLIVPHRALSYPACGDWWCDDQADWQSADPLEEPEVYRWVAVEQDIVDDPRPDWQMKRELLAMRREETNGDPLWCR
jgi:hypothetical protein